MKSHTGNDTSVCFQYWYSVFYLGIPTCLVPSLSYLVVNKSGHNFSLIFQENKSTKTTQIMNQPGGFNMPSAPSAPGGPGFDPSSTSLPTSTVEISVRCTDLADKDLMSKSDPICVMFMQKQGKWFEIGRTEMIADTLNPSWEKKFVVDYSFEERQVVKFEIYDWDVDSKLLSDHDFLG